jgi:hypothetical protein
MSQTDAEENILSETIAGQGDSDNLKLVPVAESIRYRKRAQSAEKRNEALAERLKEAESEATKISEQLNNIRSEQELMRKLAVAGAIDLETAVSVAKARMGGEAQMDLDGVIEQLKKEKQYLFGNNTGGAVTAKKTAGAKDRIQNNQTILERAAKKAAMTGSRTDLQEYLKLRRNFV